MIDIILQFGLLVCVGMVLMHLASIYLRKREIRRAQQLRKHVVAQFMAGAMDWLHHNGWDVDPNAGSDVIYDEGKYVFVVMNRRDDAPEGEFDQQMGHLIHGVGGNTRVVAMVYPNTGDDCRLDMDAVNDLTRYMRWTRATGGIVMTNLKPTFTATLRTYDERVVIVEDTTS